MKRSAIIPEHILRDNKLSPNAKLFFGDMMAQSYGERFCIVDYKEVARLCGCAMSTISKWVSELKKRGYVGEISTIKDSDNKPYLQQIQLIYTRKSL